MTPFVRLHLVAICVLAGAASLSGQAWEGAYARWREMYDEVFPPIMKLAAQAELLGRPDIAETYRNSAKGRLEELSLEFLAANPPAERCPAYADALIEVASVVVTVFPRGTGDLFRDRVVETLSCPSLPVTPVAIPWGSQWSARFDALQDVGGGVYSANMQGVLRVPDVALNDMVPDTILLRQVKGRGSPAAAGMFFAFFAVMSAETRNEFGGFVTAVFPGFTRQYGLTVITCPGLSGGGAFRRYVRVNLRPEKGGMRLVALDADTSMPKNVVTQRYQCTSRTEWRDGTVYERVDEETWAVAEEEIGGVLSWVHGDMVVPYNDGTYELYRLNDPAYPSQTSIVTVTLACITACPTHH